MLLPSNKLEEALHKAAADNTQAPDFYEKLMESKIFVLGEPEKQADGAFTLEDEQAVLIQHWEREADNSPVVPFFTSLQMLQQAIPKDEPYLELKTTDLFQLTMGAPLVLNPNSEFGMEFDPDDVAILLDTELMQNSEHTLEEQTEVLLGHADNVSNAFKSVLIAYFESQPEVEAAYLGTIQIPEDDDQEHLMVGIQGEGSLESVIDTAIQKISLVGDDDMAYETVDFYRIDQDDPDISEFMVENIMPFYVAESRVVH